jgi:hypothetical protein
MEPEVSDAVAWYVREVLTKWLAENKGETPASLARLIKVSKMTTGKLVKGTRPGLKLARHTATHLLKMPLEKLEEIAAIEYRARGEREMRAEMDDRYPNRAAVLRVLAAELHPETVKRAKTINLQSVDDMLASEWFDDIRALDRRVRRELADPDRAKAERSEKRRQVESALDDEDNDRSR